MRFGYLWLWGQFIQCSADCVGLVVFLSGLVCIFAYTVCCVESLCLFVVTGYYRF